MTQLRSPRLIGRGIRSSWELTHCDTASYTLEFAIVREIPTPNHIVIDGKTGVLKAVWSGAQVLAHARKSGL